MEKDKKETILCSAVRRLKSRDPKECNVGYRSDLLHVEIGYRHFDILSRFKGEVSRELEAQGFLTSKGRFVSREEAYKIAVKAGQVTAGATISDYKLYSEDLY